MNDLVLQKDTRHLHLGNFYCNTNAKVTVSCILVSHPPCACFCGPALLDINL